MIWTAISHPRKHALAINMKIYFISIVDMKVKLKTTMKYNFVPNRMRKMYKLMKTKCQGVCGEMGRLLVEV